MGLRINILISVVFNDPFDQRFSDNSKWNIKELGLVRNKEKKPKILASK